MPTNCQDADVLGNLSFFYQFMHAQFTGTHPMICNSQYNDVLLKINESKPRKSSSSTFFILASMHSPKRSSSVWSLVSGVCLGISGPRPGPLWTDGQCITGHTERHTFIHRDNLVSSIQLDSATQLNPGLEVETWGFIYKMLRRNILNLIL